MSEGVWERRASGGVRGRVCKKGTVSEGVRGYESRCKIIYITFASQLMTPPPPPSDPPPNDPPPNDPSSTSVASKNCPQNSSNLVKYTLRLASFSLAFSLALRWSGKPCPDADGDCKPLPWIPSPSLLPSLLLPSSSLLPPLSLFSSLQMSRDHRTREGVELYSPGVSIPARGRV